MSFGLLKRREPEKVQRSLRPHQEISSGLLKKREPEKVQKRSQGSPLRRVHPRHKRDEEELDYYSRGNHASVQRRSSLRCDQEARSLRHVREEQTISKPKAFSKSYTANPVAKGKAVDSNSKSECRTRTTGRVHIPSPHVESGERVKSKAEAVHYRTREVRCFKCQGLGHFANECTNKKTMVLFEHGEFETKQEVENASASEEEELVKILVKDDISVSSFKTEKAVAKEQENKENDQDQLMLETKNEEAMKQSLGSIDESADALTERYSLMSTPDSYTLDFKVVEEVDFLFGNSAFSKPENKVKSLLAEVLKPRRDKQLLHCRQSKTEPVLYFEEESLFQEENGVSETFSFNHFLFLKDYKLQDLRMNHIYSPKIGMGATVQRRDPIVDKVKAGRKVMEPTILEDYGVPATPQERSLSLSLGSACRDDTDLRTNLFQEEGYDTIMESIKDDQDGTLLKPLEETQEHELDNFKDALTRIIQVILVKEDNQRTVGSFYDEIIKLPKRIHLYCSAQMKSEINWFNSMTTWIIFSTRQKLMSKWNQFNQSSDEGDIEFTSQMILSLLDFDQRTFNGGFRANQKKIELVFDCQTYSDLKKVQVVATELYDYAIIWWDQLVTSRRRKRELQVDTWNKMKHLMRKRFVPSHFLRELHQKLRRLSQGSKSVEDYFQEMEILMIKADMDENTEHTMASFLGGLARDIQDRMEIQIYDSIEEMLHKAVLEEPRVKRKGISKPFCGVDHQGDIIPPYGSSRPFELSSRGYQEDITRPDGSSRPLESSFGLEQFVPDVNMENLKSSRPNWFVSFQTYVWHPGGISTKSSKPSDMIMETLAGHPDVEQHVESAEQKDITRVEQKDTTLAEQDITEQHDTAEQEIAEQDITEQHDTAEQETAEQDISRAGRSSKQVEPVPRAEKQVEPVDDLLVVPSRPFTRARAKAFQDSINGLLVQIRDHQTSKDHTKYIGYQHMLMATPSQVD